MIPLRLPLYAAAIYGAITSSLSAQDVTFSSLLDQLVDREQMTIHPDFQSVDFTFHQASSYDTRTKNLGDQTLGQPASFANLDFSQYIRTEVNDGRTEYVMMEDSGPGAIIHVWLTGGNYGTLRVYLDGSSTPAYEGKADEVIGIATSTFGSPLSFRSRTNSENTGNNLKAPIPYNSSCKVTYDKFPTPTPGSVNNLWYYVNYFKFPDGTSVETYSESVRSLAQTKLNTTNASLNNPTAVAGAIDEQYNTDVNLAANGGESTYDLPAGENAIRRIEVKLTASDLTDALNNTWIECTFDDATTVSSPIGHFFGIGDLGLQAFASSGLSDWDDWFRSLETDGTLECRWVMPYKRTASVKLINRGTTQSVSAHLEVDSGSRTWVPGSMHFHADFETDLDLKSRGPINDYSANATGDYNYAYIRGRGVYVGDVLTVGHQSSSGNRWWGEGDEKIYVDGETFPSIIGTGTEDYYCYAFGHAELYANPWVTQPYAVGNGGPGEIINSRVRLLDVHPFQSSFRFDMEIWSWQSTDMDYRSVAYWYGIPGAVSMKLTSDAEADFPTSPPLSALYALDGTAGNAPIIVNGDGENTVAPNLFSVGSPLYDSNVPPNYGGSSSVVFDGTNFLHSDTVPTTANNNFGIEAWVYPTDQDLFNFVVSNGNTNNAGWGIMMEGGVWKIAHMGTGILATSAPVVLNEWTHVALIRDAGVSTLYVNGIAQPEILTSAPISPANSYTIGANELSPDTFEGQFKGLIDYVRVFTFEANSFDQNTDLSYNPITPGTSALYAMEGNSASAITSQPGDGIGTTAPTLTNTGTPQYSVNVPPANGGSYSAFFDGSSRLNANSVPITATNNFGLEAWVYPTSIDALDFVVSNGNTNNTGYGIAQSGGFWTMLHMGQTVQVTAAPVNLNTWTHLALVRQNGVTRLYVDGVAQFATILTAPIAPGNSFTVGANQLTASTFEAEFNGNIDYVRAFTFEADEFLPATHLSYQFTRAHQVNQLVIPHDKDLGSSSSGSGQWSYHSSSLANPNAVGAIVTNLNVGNVGDQGSTGFGGGQALGANATANLPAISGGYIFSTGSDNIPIQGQPGYHELEVQPGEGAVGDSSNPPFAVARWTAGAEDDGTIAILGSIRNLIASGDGIDFAIYHNGTQLFSASEVDNVMAETPFDLNQYVNPGDTIDFVVGNKGSSDASGDEAALRAQIFVPRGLPDLDGDSLESWEESFIGTDPEDADGDKDGQNDGIENLAGSDPFDPTSRFEIYTITHTETGASIAWTFKAGNTYTIHRSDTLEASSWTPVATGVDTGTWTDTSPEALSADRYFYRVSIEN